MPEIPRTKFNSPWTVAVIEAALNDVSSAKGSSESLTAALNAMRAEINSLSGGVHLKGAVDYYSDLPASPSEGDAYTVRYQGTSGTDPLGIEYAWATYQGTPQWIPIGVDPSVFAKQAEMNVVANAGAKNFAVPFNPISTTDIAVTQNVDGSYTFVCTNVSENRVIRVANIGDLPSGSYTFSGTTDGSSSSYMLGLYNTSSTAVKYQRTNAEESYTGNVSGFSLRVRVISGYSGTFTVYPMIRPAAITDPTFQPYARTNPTLTAEMDYVVNAGAKNLLPMTHTNGSITRYGVTCAWDSNSGTMTLNGAHSSGDSTAIFEFYDGSAEDTKILPAGSYVLTGCPAGGSTSSYRAILSQITGAIDIGNGVNFELSEPHYAAYRILISGNVTFNNMVFKPMIRPAAITDPTFQPYAPTNRELYEMILALQSGGNRALTMQTLQPTDFEEQEER